MRRGPALSGAKRKSATQRVSRTATIATRTPIVELPSRLVALPDGQKGQRIARGEDGNADEIEKKRQDGSKETSHPRPQPRGSQIAADATDALGIEPFGSVADTDDQAERDDEQEKSRQAGIARELGVGRAESGGDIVEACEEGARIPADQLALLLDIAEQRIRALGRARSRRRSCRDRRAADRGPAASLEAGDRDRSAPVR